MQFIVHKGQTYEFLLKSVNWTTNCLSTILELHWPQTCNIHAIFGHYTAVLIKRRCNWIGVHKNTTDKCRPSISYLCTLNYATFSYDRIPTSITIWAHRLRPDYFVVYKRWPFTQASLHVLMKLVYPSKTQSYIKSRQRCRHSHSDCIDALKIETSKAICNT